MTTMTSHELGSGTRRRLLDSDLSLDFLRVVEQAAIACAHTMGQGDRHKSDQVAVEAMRQRDGLGADRRHDRHRRGRARRGADALHRREGRHGRPRGEAAGDYPQVDIAVDPLEGTNLCATGAPNALAVLAASEKGGLLHAPDIYMEKLVVGPSSRDVVDLDAPVRFNLRAIAQSLGRKVEDLVVIVLDRPRHEKLIEEIRSSGARIRLIGDGDLSAGITAAVRRQRRARGDGDRRRARRRDHRGGDALPRRRDLRAARRQHARARAALPRDGHHRLQEGLPVEGPRVRATTSSSRRPASPTAR